MVKKNIIIAMLTTILVLQFGTIVYAESNEDVLFKFETEKPVILHNEQIKIPVAFDNSKEQFRGVWVSTVSNIDFPSKETLQDGTITKEEYINDYNRLLDRAEELNLNTLIFQVSPMLDAWYKSDVNPWSQYLSGSQGKDPKYEEWDSMEWMIEETHKRGLEFHAWFNPYRVTNNPKDTRGKDEKLAELVEGNFARKNPELVYEFENRLYLEPGKLEVTQHIVDTVEEVINKYDVDAIHFDDYFYPYQYANKVKGNTNPPDKKVFEELSDGKTDIDDWRRNNIDNMIKTIDKSITDYNKKNKRSIEFGISPFGIWGHADETNGVGSHTPTGSTSSYEDYVDSLKWAKEGWIDYLIPQVYWSFANNSAPYGELVDWWANKFSEIDKSHLYIGHSNYKHLNEANDSDWRNSDEIPAQLRFNQKYSTIKGEAFFSYRSISKDTEKQNDSVVNQSIDSIKEKCFNILANTSAKPWLDHMETRQVKDLEVEDIDGELQLKWKDKNKDTRFYVIYRVEGIEDTIDTSNPNNIIGRIGKENGSFFTDKDLDLNKNYTYGVTVIDEAGNETEVNCVKSVVELSNVKSFNISLVGLILGGILLIGSCILGIILVGFL